MSANHSLQKLLDELGRLPGIGPKSAQRIAYYLLEADAEEARRLAEAILEVKQEVHFCSRCFNYATADECSICQDPMRDTTRICVVGEPRDVQAIERTDKIGPEQLHIRELLARLGHEDIHEVIIATNPNIEGETTASYLARTIKPLGVEVSRLASGLPVGGDLEYADELTLGRAIEARRDLGGEPAPAVCFPRDARGSHNFPERLWVCCATKMLRIRLSHGCFRSHP